MNIALIQVPYDSGHRGRRMGRGPVHLVEQDAAKRLRSKGHAVSVTSIETADAFPAEIATTFELTRRLARQVRAATSVKRFPLILAGNCSCCLGALAGLGTTEDVGVLWFDTHADFNTPETTTSGFLDGMALSIITGHCWQPMAASIPGFRPVREEHVVLIGARDLDALERERLAHSRLSLIAPERVRHEEVQAAIEPALASLCTRVQALYLHIDMDVLDPKEARANSFAAPGGLTTKEVLGAITYAARRLPIVAAALASYDPAHDADGRALQAACTFMEHIVERVSGGDPY